MFFTRYENLCKNEKKTTTGVAAELGIAKSTVAYWRANNNVIPKQDVLLKIAEYFNVSVDYLLGNETKEAPAADSDEILSFALYGSDNKDITPGMLEDVRNFAQYIREKRKGENK